MSDPGTAVSETPSPYDEVLRTLSAIERRVLWLAVRIVDYANRERENTDELKVGGHQASSASMVTLMTALYFADLDARDRVSVKPHASPVLHAIEYLLGRLDRSYLTRLRDFGGLQSYPSRTKDPFPVDYSTGSVGLGSAAPIFGALADRYVGSHGGAATGGRFISLLGDAELDEGNIWEALAEPLTRKLGNVLWLVDLNRQSLDRVIPGIKAQELERNFETVGWHVLELKYGRRLRAAFALEGGDVLRQRIDEMPNEQYQSLFAASDEVVRETLLEPLAAGAAGASGRAARPLRGRSATSGLGSRRPRHRGRARGVRGRAGGDGAADGGVRVHDQGVRPGDRRPTAEPLGAADRFADRRVPAGVRPDAGDGVGRVRARLERGEGVRDGSACGWRARRGRHRRGSMSRRRCRRETARRRRRRQRSVGRCSISHAWRVWPTGW